MTPDFCFSVRRLDFVAHTFPKVSILNHVRVANEGVLVGGYTTYFLYFMNNVALLINT